MYFYKNHGLLLHNLVQLYNALLMWFKYNGGDLVVSDNLILLVVLVVNFGDRFII